MLLSQTLCASDAFTVPPSEAPAPVNDHVSVSPTALRVARGNPRCVTTSDKYRFVAPAVTGMATTV
jgi:hypothetical protein